MAITLEHHLKNRDYLISRIRAEVVGPDPFGSPLPFPEDGIFIFKSWNEWYAPHKQQNGDEVLKTDSPLKRFGAGILFPSKIKNSEFLPENDSPDDQAEPGQYENQVNDNRYEKELIKTEKKKIQDAEKHRIESAEKISKKNLDPKESAPDEDVSLANNLKPSAIGLSLMSALPDDITHVCLQVKWAVYRPSKAQVNSDNEHFERILWLRYPETREIKISRDDLKQRCVIPIEDYEQQLQIVVVPRQPFDNSLFPDASVYSIMLINITDAANKQFNNKCLDELCFFQVEFLVEGVDENGKSVPWILPYPEPRRTVPDKEEEDLRLQYRLRETYAVGHGCAATWEPREDERIRATVRTDVLPQFEVPSVSPEAIDRNGEAIQVSMRALSDLENDEQNEGLRQLRYLIGQYGLWIGREEKRISDGGIDDIPLDNSLLEAAGRSIEKLRMCHQRIQSGLDFLLRSDQAHALEAFRLANLAMYKSQCRSSREKRTPEFENQAYQWPDFLPVNENVGWWRSFQIAFILMGIPGIVDEAHEDRETVDLIWFPTGGGKTEAYFGLIAFTLFYNRLAGREASGAEVIMRYTLRLLTSQQFQRATLLFCAIEHVRKQYNRENADLLGAKRFRIGLWVGGATTPNQHGGRFGAVAKFGEIQHAMRGNNPRDPETVDNPFPILKCPWCHAYMGPIRFGAARNRVGRILGYHSQGGRIDFKCPDPACEFHGEPLPVWIIDEDIYNEPPSMVVATVDKFAGLPFNPQIRRIFGIEADGNITDSNHPPTLIIQDELHLISGPLGTMVGLYETLIEELCIHHEGEQTIRPKIVASTATISRADEQIRALYARECAQLFPPHGLDVGHSFFSREEPVGNGRIYLGILASNHGSQQTTQARLYASITESVGRMQLDGGDEVERDPFWTLVVFFNSLRELGGAASLLVSDVPDYQKVLYHRWGGPRRTRYLDHIEELTSRISGNKIPGIIEKLELPCPVVENHHPLDVCLASNIIEVGVDIDRLSLMTIIGQPKTTAQYIQVSSRVGRRTRERPGVVLTVYQPTRPRDRSHYERFQTYHDRLYALVEPTSVTPFSPPSIKRALHAVLVGFVRDRTTQGTEPTFPDNLKERIFDLIAQRVGIVDTTETDNVFSVLSKLIARWQTWPPQIWGDYFYAEEQTPLIHPAGGYVRPEWKPEPWETMTSLRDVDKTCEGDVTGWFMNNNQEQEGNN